MMNVFTASLIAENPTIKYENA